jgi:hypothetical protein
VVVVAVVVAVEEGVEVEVDLGARAEKSCQP